MSEQSFRNYLEQDVWTKAACAALAGGVDSFDVGRVADLVVLGLRSRRSAHLEEQDNPKDNPKERERLAYGR